MQRDLEAWRGFVAEREAWEATLLDGGVIAHVWAVDVDSALDAPPLGGPATGRLPDRRSRREPFLEDKPHWRRDDATGQPLDWQELLPSTVDTELAVEARELLRGLAGLRWHQRTVLTLQLAGYSYTEIAERLGKTYTWVNRHLTEGRAELRHRQACEVEAAERGSPGRAPALIAGRSAGS